MGCASAHRDVALAWVVAGIPVVLVLAQPDLGSALVLVAMAVVIIAAAGAPGLWTVGGARRRGRRPWPRPS